ncbi:hypothetical protein M407DRAFT_31677 [Tulasnella calospora MUT 4182]|uniref:Retrotransposon gag domain-containing protein n=1 Tax=Tulasnella calospora MUT 4182 TaxID=1051891 RepID=A0A0C3Q586_9AGAM|nr:hypothetical protein M407DRAFT_31677 [Tulasnella calospora MUT 4182]
MADPYSEPKMFGGRDPKECEAFVAAVRRRGLAQGKHRDDEWMAVFASGYLSGDALYWYEDLDKDAKNDWSRLCPALLARFGRNDKTATATSRLRSALLARFSRRDKAPNANMGAPAISTSTSSTTIPT